MKFLVQRVKQASVCVDSKITGNIRKGLLVFVGISDQDNEDVADRMISKLSLLLNISERIVL